MSLRDKIEGNELDLSLNLLKEVPVKELASATKAIHLDISCNHIEFLPNDFATLTHLVKIDLSKNRLVELPTNFGNLINLQCLDLYSNLIVDLPLSFSRLKNLRWLDLKNNPLSPSLRATAGNCVSEKECQDCAKKVVAHMQVLESGFEREKQKKLKAAREKEAIEKAKLERELEEQRRLKKLEKERRKAESKAKREAMLSQKQETSNDYEKKGQFNSKKTINKESSFQNEGFNCCKFLMFLIPVLCLILISGIFWAIHVEIISIKDIDITLKEAKNTFQQLASDILKAFIYYTPILKEFCLKIIHNCMMTVTHLATNIEQMIAHYFDK